MRSSFLVFVCFTFALSCGAIRPRTASPGWDFPDSEFLYWCERSDDVWPVYLDPPEGCDKVSRGFWEPERLPLRVTADPELLPEVAEAIAGFNEQVGFDLFVLDVVVATQPDILFLVAGTHPFAAAEAKHFSIAGRHYGGVLVYNGYEHFDRSDIMMHELGHIVGLRHDDSKMSIMYAGQGSRIAVLEKIDVKTLRKIYKKK